ncbi:UPF0193 protein EVG1-like isoform X2 [Limulus polyphemus]|uniref:UPF0193 protein EVG1-like isoform X2 n=1 Tax=Limulus polyphemus TaxID=6850 RepID=A0ABM1B1T9_LIMPO|nr:UPF0193 protein EVG1-like isoform X2 [Limulus polyphemus]
MTFCNSNNNTRFTTRYQYDWKNYKKPKDMCSSALSMGYSQTTQDLVKALMDEAKLSVRLQEGVTKCMKDGRSLFCANLQEHNLSRYKRNKNPVIRTPKDCLRNTISCGLRSRKSIEESGAYEREKFKPSPSLVLNEIMERRKFLEDMKQLGHEKYYSDMIQFQISQKIKELEAIDQKRMKELGNIMSKGSL